MTTGLHRKSLPTVPLIFLCKEIRTWYWTALAGKHWNLATPLTNSERNGAPPFVINNEHTRNFRQKWARPSAAALEKFCKSSRHMRCAVTHSAISSGIASRWYLEHIVKRVGHNPAEVKLYRVNQSANKSTVLVDVTQETNTRTVKETLRMLLRGVH